ncbi:MAG: diguanylate cyclase [Sulfuritalea sp.]|nr:diguanylate cyclase [Sulfuritalea sp.]
MPRFSAFLFLLCCWSCHIGATFGAVRLAPGVTSLALAAEVAVLEDPNGRLSLDDVKGRGADFTASQLPADAAINFGYSSSAWWLRFTIEANPVAPRDWLLEVAFPTLDSVEYFGPGGEHLSAGDHLPFAARPLLHRNFVFPLHLRETGDSTVWLRVASEGTLTVPLRLWRTETFWQQSQASYAVLSIYFGMLLALALYNLLLWLSLRDQTYLTYVLFATSMAVGQLSFNGLGNQFLWPNWPLWGNFAYTGGFAAAGLFGALFTRGFLHTRRNVPRLDGAVIGLAALFGLCMVAPLVVPYRLAAILVSLTGVTFSLVAMLAGFRCWRTGQPGARTFLLAWAVLLLGVAIAGLRNLNLLPTIFFSFYALQIGSALEMLLLSFALADRINGLRHEKDAAQSEALATKQQLVGALQRSEASLEQRVAERTAELEAANARLRENERQLQSLAHTDTLTGLANRLLFDARLQQSMQQARRSHGQIAVLLVDLDHFKAINDGYGHAIGDEVLRCMADRFRATVREVDTVARLGGDEFAIVLTGLSSGADAEHMAQKIITNLGAPMRVLGLPLEIGASIGIALFSSGDLSPAELLRRADQAMYAAKDAGRGCYRMFA